jgi:hypothetical protein
MGQEPSNIALEVALATKPNYTILAEEVEANNISLAGIVKDIADMVEERARRGLNYGRSDLPFVLCSSLTLSLIDSPLCRWQCGDPRGTDRVDPRAQAAAPRTGCGLQGSQSHWRAHHWGQSLPALLSLISLVH